MAIKGWQRKLKNFEKSLTTTEKFERKNPDKQKSKKFEQEDTALLEKLGNYFPLIAH